MQSGRTGPIGTLCQRKSPPSLKGAKSTLLCLSYKSEKLVHKLHDANYVAIYPEGQLCSTLPPSSRVTCRGMYAHVNEVQSSNLASFGKQLTATVDVCLAKRMMRLLLVCFTVWRLL